LAVDIIFQFPNGLVLAGNFEDKCQHVQSQSIQYSETNR